MQINPHWMDKFKVRSLGVNIGEIVEAGGKKGIEHLLLSLGDYLVSGNILVKNLKGNWVCATSMFSCQVPI